MNTDQQTFAALATANEDRRKSMLQYVSEGATAADLKAAGYTPAEISTLPLPESIKPVVPTGTIEKYTPTFRENFRENVRRGASAFGTDKQTAQLISDRVAGSATNGDMGAIDLVGLGVIPGVQEGVQKAERGYKTGSKTDMALGALDVGLNVLGAIPGGKVITKGVSKGTEKLAERVIANSDPNVVRMFGGPSAKNFPLDKEDAALEMLKKGEDEDKIWRDTGIQFLDSRPIFQIDPAGSKLNNFKDLKETDYDLPKVLDFPELYQNYPTLESFKINFTPEVEGANFDANTFNINVNPDYLGKDPKELHKTLLHELQHGIQAIEQTSGGASPSYFLSRELEVDPLTGKEEATGKFVSGVADMQADVKELNRLEDNAIKARDDYLKAQSEGGLLQKVLGSKELKALNRKYLEAYSDFQAKGHDLYQLAFDKYQENPGEIEARAASLWSELTPEERLKTKPSDIYDKAYGYAKFLDPAKYGDNYMPTMRLPASEKEMRKQLDLGAEAVKKIDSTKSGVSNDSLTDVGSQATKQDEDKTIEALGITPNSLDVPKTKGNTITDTKEFQNWFGKSVTSTEGKPHILYTGTSKDKDFTSFNVGRHGTWFTRDPEEASQYAIQNDSQGYKQDGWKLTPTNTASRVIPAYVKAENPYTGDLPEEVLQSNYKAAQSNWFDTLRSKGYDSWIPSRYNGDLVVVLKEPQQIKSIFNNGKFDPNQKHMNKAEGGLIGYAQGGTVEEEQMDKLMQEGGIAGSNVTHEPVTGNEVPPGSLPSEVRDDVPTQLSQGEYVVPADVVRFFGVKYFEDLRTQAKQGLQEMQAGGRIGGASVDDNGVPTEEDQLTPEEEQMLNQALGQSAAKPGMAYGGMVRGMAEGGATGTDTPAFDRTTFNLSDYGNSNGIEYRQYYNPQTKETRMLQFIGGQSLGLIPDGFVLWYEGIDKVEPTPDTNTDTGTGGTGNGGRGEGGGGGGGGQAGGGTGGTGSGTDGINNWVSENFDTISTDPYQAGIDALKNKDGKLTGKIVGGGAMLAANLVPGLGTAAIIGAAGYKAYDNLNSIAQANASLKILEDQGKKNTPEYQKLKEATDAAIDDLPAAQQVLVNAGVAATGTDMFNDWKKEQAKRIGAAANPNVIQAGAVQQGGGNRNTNTYVPPQTRNDGGGSNAIGAPITPKVTYSIGAGNTGTGGNGGGNNAQVGGGGGTGGPGNVSAGVQPVNTGTGNTNNAQVGGGGGTGGPGNVSAGVRPVNTGNTYGQGGTQTQDRRAKGGLITKNIKTTPKTKGLAGKQ